MSLPELPEDLRKTPREVSPHLVFPSGMTIKGAPLLFMVLFCWGVVFHQVQEAYQNINIRRLPGLPGVITVVDEPARSIEYTFQNSSNQAQTDRITYQKIKGRFPRDAKVGQPILVWEMLQFGSKYPISSLTFSPDNLDQYGITVHVLLILFFGLLGGIGTNDLFVARRYRRVAREGSTTISKVLSVGAGVKQK